MNNALVPTLNSQSRTNSVMNSGPLSEEITSVQTLKNDLPQEFTLHQNSRNPFNPSTTIKHELPRPSHVRLSVFGVLGREVSPLVDESKDVGVHEV